MLLNLMRRTQPARRLIAGGVLLVLLLSLVVAQAQDLPTLNPGVPLEDGIAPGVVREYRFSASAGENIRLLITNQDGLALSALVTDVNGGIVAQGRDNSASGTVSISAALGQSGDYFVSVVPIAGLNAGAEGDFVIILNPGAQPDTAAPAADETADTTDETVAEEDAATVEAETVDATTDRVFGEFVQSGGIQVQLEWNAPVDLDLEVRDPVGGTVFFDSTTTSSGGVFGENVNAGCNDPVVATNAVEQASWNAGEIPAGSYEILVYHQQSCQTGAPVDFVVTPTVNGETLESITGRMLEGQIFVSSFFVADDGSGAISERSGLKAETAQLPASAADLIADAQPVNPPSDINGTITSDQPYQTFTFEAAAGTIISASLNASAGGLDPYIALIDGSGTVISFNDDTADGVTDSTLPDTTLPADGSYTVVATRYGVDFGGTEGTFNLSIQATTGGDVAAAPDEGLDAAEDTTDDTAVATAPAPTGGATPIAVVPTQPGASGGLPPEIQALGLPLGNIEITLAWNTGADVRLLVRDPVGDSVYPDVRQIRSGGTMVEFGNAGCREGGSPVSYIYWPTTVTPRSGTYEIDVWLQNECNDISAVNATVYISIAGQLVLVDSADLLLDDHYVTSFTITDNRQLLAGQGGITGLDSLNWRAEATTAIPVLNDTPVAEAITLEDKFDLYVFNGIEGDLVSVEMIAAAGTNLDPKLYLIGPDGEVIAENDDVVPGDNINSLINNEILPEDGQYIIIATHYGEQFGVTTGNYTLTLEQSS